MSATPPSAGCTTPALSRSQAQTRSRETVKSMVREMTWEALGSAARPKPCKGMAGLVAEGEEVITLGITLHTGACRRCRRPRRGLSRAGGQWLRRVSKKSNSPKLREWRVILMRYRGEFRGTPQRFDAAQALAAKRFGLSDFTGSETDCSPGRSCDSRGRRGVGQRPRLSPGSVVSG
jgi:hypothetical protein